MDELDQLVPVNEVKLPCDACAPCSQLLVGRAMDRIPGLNIAMITAMITKEKLLFTTGWSKKFMTTWMQ